MNNNRFFFFNTNVYAFYHIINSLELCRRFLNSKHRHVVWSFFGNNPLHRCIVIVRIYRTCLKLTV